MSKSRKKRAPKRVLALPDLEQAKSAVLNTLTSMSGQRTYDHAINDFVDWYCSEPRLAFNRTVVLRYRIFLEQKGYAPNTINLRLAAVRRVASEACDSGLLSPELYRSGNSAGQGSPAPRRPRWQLAHARPGEATAGTVGHRHPAGKTEPRDSGDANRLRPTPRRTSVFGDGFHSGSRGALGYRGPNGQGGAHPDGSGAAMGQGRRRRLEHCCWNHRRYSVPCDQQIRWRVGRRHDAEGAVGGREGSGHSCRHRETRAA